MSSFSSTLDNQESRVYQLGNHMVRNVTGEGFELTPNGISIDIAPGYCDIDGKYHETTESINQALSPRKAGLLYAQKSTYSDSPQFGVVNATLPEPDNNTIAQWRINSSGNIVNYAVGRSSIAVTNDLVPSGTLTKVDGWLDYAIQGDGSTGSFTSANSTGFPTGATEREIDFLITAATKATAQALFYYGAVSSTNLFGLELKSTGNFDFDNYAHTDLGYTTDGMKVYWGCLQYDGANILLYINGVLVYKGAATLATTASVLNVLRHPNSTDYSSSTIHYIELRNKMRTPAQIAQISNKLCLPCSYTAPQASYPVISASDLASAYHEYKMDETTGSTVADSAGTLNGTATGTTIVDSEIGLGKSRKFNGTSDKITCAAFTFSSSFTVIGIVKPDSNSGVRTLFGNSNGTTGTTLKISRSTDTSIGAWSNNGEVSGLATLPLGKTCFVGYVAQNNTMTFYADSPQPSTTVPFTPNTSNANALQIGANGNNTEFLAGNIDDVLYIPRALSQAEIAVIYNTLMKTGKFDIREILPENAISRGFVKTDSSKVVEYDQESYKYGVRYADKRNQRMFLGYKYFSGQQTLKWDNPFGTRKIKTYYTWAQDANGTNECDVQQYMYNGSQYYGLQVNGGYSSIRVQCFTPPGGVTSFNNTWQTSGYIGCYAEVIE